MTKIEITAAMVERAVKAGYRWQGPGGYIVGDDAAAHVRMVLDAALNPPPEPEIEITREMSLAGAQAYNADLMFNHQPVNPTGMVRISSIMAAYRAMRALESKSTRPVWTKVDQPPERGRGYRFHARSRDVGYPHSHRRAGDLK